MDTATTEIYTLSLHDALPISRRREAYPRDLRRARRGHALCHGGLQAGGALRARISKTGERQDGRHGADRKSTRLNSSHSQISYAVFCLKKKKTKKQILKWNTK